MQFIKIERDMYCNIIILHSVVPLEIELSEARIQFGKANWCRFNPKRKQYQYRGDKTLISQRHGLFFIKNSSYKWRQLKEPKYQTSLKICNNIIFPDIYHQHACNDRLQLAISV